MGREAVATIGNVFTPDNLEEAIAKKVALIDGATREKDGGTFVGAEWMGEVVTW